MSDIDFDLLARYYDLEHADFDDDLAIYLGFAHRTGSPLLEYGCGTGRLLKPLAVAGYKITGIDLSVEMLWRANERLTLPRDLRDRARLVKADALHYVPPEPAKLAFWAINSFMHLATQHDQIKALTRAWEALAEGGLLILDLFQPDPQMLLEADGRLIHDGTWMRVENGNHVVKLSSRKLDIAQQTIEVTNIYDETWPDGQTSRVVAPFTMRYLHRFEAQLLLERAGFLVEALYGDYGLEPFGGYSPRMIFVARKGP